MGRMPFAQELTERAQCERGDILAAAGWAASSRSWSLRRLLDGSRERGRGRSLGRGGAQPPATCGTQITPSIENEVVYMHELEQAHHHRGYVRFDPNVPAFDASVADRLNQET